MADNEELKPAYRVDGYKRRRSTRITPRIPCKQPRSRATQPQKETTDPDPSVPITPHHTAPQSPKMNSPYTFSPFTIKGTSSNLSPLPAWPPPEEEPPRTMYVKIPHREMGFNHLTWWLVDLKHEPPMEQGATAVVANCLEQYEDWDETLARRVLQGYRQYLALATEEQDWKSQKLMPPPLIDRMWIVHVQDLAVYCHDCMILCGQVLSRNVGNKDQNERREYTLQRLVSKYGKKYDREIWSYDEDVEDSEDTKMLGIKEAAEEKLSSNEKSQDGEKDYKEKSTVGSRQCSTTVSESGPDDKEGLESSKKKELVQESVLDDDDKKNSQPGSSVKSSNVTTSNPTPTAHLQPKSTKEDEDKVEELRPKEVIRSNKKTEDDCKKTKRSSQERNSKSESKSAAGPAQQTTKSTLPSACDDISIFSDMGDRTVASNAVCQGQPKLETAKEKSPSTLEQNSQSKREQTSEEFPSTPDRKPQSKREKTNEQVLPRPDRESEPKREKAKEQVSSTPDQNSKKPASPPNPNYSVNIVYPCKGTKTRQRIQSNESFRHLFDKIPYRKHGIHREDVQHFYMVSSPERIPIRADQRPRDVGLSNNDTIELAVESKGSTMEADSPAEPSKPTKSPKAVANAALTKEASPPSPANEEEQQVIKGKGSKTIDDERSAVDEKGAVRDVAKTSGKKESASDAKEEKASERKGAKRERNNPSIEEDQAPEETKQGKKKQARGGKRRRRVSEREAEKLVMIYPMFSPAQRRGRNVHQANMAGEGTRFSMRRQGKRRKRAQP